MLEKSAGTYPGHIGPKGEKKLLRKSKYLENCEDRDNQAKQLGVPLFSVTFQVI